MKLLRAEFLNFRLLRDLTLDFATEPDRKLTVIRAANESGKTTVLHGLQWALYGDSALPNRGVGFRLYPIDWDVSDGTQVLVAATVEFELTTYRRMARTTREARQRYRLLRATVEEVDGRSRRPPSTVKLFRLGETGAQPVEEPDSFIRDELPPDLREVFFTDGDRALSFIEAEVARSTKRARVQGAIRSLLGLGVIDKAITHVRKAATAVNRKAKKVGGHGELTRIATRLQEMEQLGDKLREQLKDANQQFRAFDEKVEQTDKKIADALQKGDRQKLRREIEYARSQTKKLNKQLTVVKKDHSALFRTRAIATDVLAPVLGRAFDKLEELHDQGKIPNTTIPVLQDRLEAELCICGETLKPGYTADDRRRDYIRQLIDDNRRADQIQEIITDLYFGAKPLQATGPNRESRWNVEYKKVVERHDDIKTSRDEMGRKVRALDTELKSIPSTDIQGLRTTRRQYKEQRDRQLASRARIETQLSELRSRKKEMERKRDRLLGEQQKGLRVLAERDVTQDVMKVLRNSYDQITNEELDKVSKLMNRIFLEMIGADPEQGAIIRHAEISREYDIIVYGPNKKTLDPDRDLNGASRRALTLAFILALTKVSEVEAPNVIDTPLGMTSGFVKRSILRTAVRESAQLILFLTHDEIAGCEEIIDESAGVVFTLTNPAHYPTMLVHNPGVTETKVIRCSCNHRGVCQVCQRRLDADTNLRSTQ